MKEEPSCKKLTNMGKDYCSNLMAYCSEPSQKLIANQLGWGLGWVCGDGSIMGKQIPGRKN